MPKPFVQLSIAEFIDLLGRFQFKRQIDAVHMHHTWIPRRSQYRGQGTIEAMDRDHRENRGFSDIAQHITALPPQFVTRDEVPADLVAKEREIARATAVEEGKPEAALDKIVEGRVTGFFKENVLVEQAFAKDNKKTVGKVLEEAGVQVLGFARFKVGQA